jgi:hypothetical protein
MSNHVKNNKSNLMINVDGP